MLIKETADEKDKVTRSIDYTRHVSANGMIVKITPRATRSGQIAERKDSFEIYDTEGQLTASVSATGLVTEHRYNQARRYSITKVYADPINVADLKKEPSASLAYWRGYAPELEAGQLRFALSNRKEPHADQDRETITIFTVNKQPQFIVDAENYLKELRYDTKGHCIAEIRYKIALSAAERADLLAGRGLSRQPDRENARIVSRFYSADGHLKALQDEAGYVTVHELNAIGLATEKRHYLEPVSDYTEDFAHFKFEAEKSVSEHFSYDALGRPTLHINAEGYATAFQYEAHGAPCLIRHYLKRIKPEARRAPDLTGLAFEDDVITYDELKREQTITYANGRQVTKLYDTMNNVLKVINAEANKTEKTGDTYRETRFEYNLFQEKIAQADPLAMLKIYAQQTIDKDFLWQRLAERQFRDAHGQVTHVEDALGQRTLFYYDEEMRPLVYIDATGGVRENSYNGFGELVTERHYCNRLSSADLYSLKGGLMTASLKQRLEELRSAEDRILQQETDKRGNAVKKWDAENQLTRLTYNAFGECTTEIRPPDELKRSLTISREYENRGNVISSTESAPDIITCTTQTEYNHHLGLATQITAPNGGKTRFTYDAVGNIETVYKATDEKNWYIAEVNRWDAFKRRKSTVNADGVEKHYQYKSGGRSVLIKTGQHKAISIYNAFAEKHIHDHGAKVLDFYEHDADGGVASTHNALYQVSSVNRNVLGDIDTHYDAEKGLVSFKHNAARQLISERIDPAGLNLETTLEPNAFGEATIKTDARGITTEQQFTRIGKVKKSTIKARTALPESKLVKATEQKVKEQQKKLEHLAISPQDKSGFALRASQARTTPPAEIDLASTFLFNAFGSMTETTEGDAKQPVMRRFYLIKFPGFELCSLVAFNLPNSLLRF